MIGAESVTRLLKYVRNRSDTSFERFRNFFLASRRIEFLKIYYISLIVQLDTAGRTASHYIIVNFFFFPRLVCQPEDVEQVEQCQRRQLGVFKRLKNKCCSKHARKVRIIYIGSCVPQEDN